MPIQFRENPANPGVWQIYDTESGTALITMGAGTTLDFVAGAVELAAIPDASLTDAKMALTDLALGASGTAGSLKIYPTTAAKGRINIQAVNNAGDTQTTITNASQAAARVYTIPDGGTDASFMLTEGAQTINGVQTTTLPRVLDANTTITAFATGGQASATALTGEFNNVTVCATAGDSVKLPAAVAGQQITVRNSGAANLAVFPASGDAINALAVNLSIDIPPLGEVMFTAIDATTWYTRGKVSLSAPSTQKGTLIIAPADSAGNTDTIITNASQAAARTYTIPDAGASASFVMTEGAQTINGNKTYGGSQIRTAQKNVSLAVGAKVGGTAGWVVNAADNVYYATLPASQTGSKLIIPVMGLHVGDTITGFGLIGQIESAGGAVTVDCDLRSVTAAAADVTDASVATMTQIAVTADTAINATQDKGSLSQTVASDKVYYLVVTATTAGSTDVVIAGYSISYTTS